MVLILEIVVVGVVIFAVAAFIGGALPGMRPAPRDATDAGVPAGRLRSADVDQARFGLAFRGYRMGDVDALLDRLRDELGRYESNDGASDAPADAARGRERATEPVDVAPASVDVAPASVDVAPAPGHPRD